MTRPSGTEWGVDMNGVRNLGADLNVTPDDTRRLFPPDGVYVAVGHTDQEAAARAWAEDTGGRVVCRPVGPWRTAPRNPPTEGARSTR